MTKIKKSEKVSINYWIKMEEAEKLLEEIEGKIFERVDYIVKMICKINKSKPDWDLMDGAFFLKGCVAREYAQQSYVCLNYLTPIKKDLIIVDRYENEVCLLHQYGELSFPVRWLFEDFEEELEKGSKRLSEHGKVELIKSVKKKLTKEELRVIGLK